MKDTLSAIAQGYTDSVRMFEHKGHLGFLKNTKGYICREMVRPATELDELTRRLDEYHGLRAEAYLLGMLGGEIVNDVVGLTQIYVNGEKRTRKSLAYDGEKVYQKYFRT